MYCPDDAALNMEYPRQSTLPFSFMLNSSAKSSSLS